MYKFPVLKSDSVTTEHSQETSAMESVFGIGMGGVDWKAPIT